MPADLDIELLDLQGRMAVLTNGEAVPVTNLFDADGDETDDPAEAVSFVCGAGRRWLTNLVANFEPASIQ